MNEQFCPRLTTSSLCILQPDTKLIVPPNSNTYTSQIGYFSCNLVGCLEFAFLKLEPGTTNIQVSNNQLNPVVIVPDGLTKEKEIYYNNKLIGIICTSAAQRSIWIAFRGTNGVSEWKKDLMIEQVTSTIFTGLVHKGFLEIYTSIRAALLAGLAAIKITTQTAYESLYIAGHSLGGTCSQFLLLDPLLSKTLPETCTNRQIYLFGTPHVGNQSFFDSQSGQLIFRHQNQVDLVCDLPTAISPNFVGNKNDPFLYRSNQSKLIEFYNQRISYQENHSLRTYLYYFSAL